MFGQGYSPKKRIIMFCCRDPFRIKYDNSMSKNEYWLMANSTLPFSFKILVLKFFILVNNYKNSSYNNNLRKGNGYNYWIILMFFSFHFSVPTFLVRQRHSFALKMVSVVIAEIQRQRANLQI